ncbi:MAG TPA: flagellar protein FlaG [Burkholderiaceae bacterium]|nr:flagellar protein FlaG [Burkholderiaceae bacterium]
MNTVMHNLIRSVDRLDLSLPPPPPRAPAPAPAVLYAAPPPAAQSPSDPHAAAKAAAREANQKLVEKGSELALEFDDDLGRVIFKLVDTRTREVLRQIPSEAVLAVARALADEIPSGAILSTDA